MDKVNCEFSLIQWNSQKDTLFKSLSNLRNAELYTDVLVSCENNFYPAHRLILTLSSEYFARAFQLLPNGGYPVFVLCGISKQILEAILSYIYEGKVAIASDDVASFMKAGIFLEIAGLNNVTTKMSPTNDKTIQDDDVACLHETINLGTHIKQEIVEDEIIDVVNLNPILDQNEIIDSNTKPILEGNIMADMAVHFNPASSSNFHHEISLKEKTLPNNKSTLQSNTNYQDSSENEIAASLNQIKFSPKKGRQSKSKRKFKNNQDTLQKSVENLHKNNCLTSEQSPSQFGPLNIAEESRQSFLISRNSLPPSDRLKVKEEINQGFETFLDGKSSENEVELSGLENELKKIGNTARKHTRNYCRCTCCRKLFSSKQALSKHYYLMENYHPKERKLRSSKNSSHGDDATKKRRNLKRKCRFNTLPGNQVNENIISNIAEKLSPIKKYSPWKKITKGATNLSENYESPKKSFTGTTCDNSITNSNQPQTEAAKSKPIKRKKLNSSSECMDFAAVNTNSEVTDSLIKINTANHCDLSNTESTLNTDHGSFSFAISEVVSVNKNPQLLDYFEKDQFTAEALTEKSEIRQKSDKSSSEQKTSNNSYLYLKKEMEASLLPDSDETTSMKEHETPSDDKGWNKPVITCDICSNGYFSFNSFKKHKQTDCKILECPYCFHTYLPSEKSFLEVHMGIHSEQDKPFSCPECPYRSDKSRIMDDHIAIHKGIFRFWCPLCSFKGKLVNDLRTHNESNHPNMKIFD